MKRIDMNDPIAIVKQGCDYRDGTNGYPQDHNKAMELFHRAAPLDYARAYCNIGYAYQSGEGVNFDRKMAVHYYELAAMMGNERARHNLGNGELRANNMERALKHYMIAVRGGYAKSLEAIKQLYTNEKATKDDYTTALQLYQEYLGEIKSVQRDKAAADREDHRYY